MAHQPQPLRPSLHRLVGATLPCFAFTYQSKVREKISISISELASYGAGEIRATEGNRSSTAGKVDTRYVPVINAELRKQTLLTLPYGIPCGRLPFGKGSAVSYLLIVH